MSRDNGQKIEESFYMGMSRDNDKKDAYISNAMRLQNLSLTSIHKNKSLLSATSILSHSAKAYNTTASLDTLTCIDYVEFGKRQDNFSRISLSKNDSNYLDLILKSSKEDDNKEFRLVQNLTVGEPDFDQFMRLRNQLVIATKNFAREQKLVPSANTYNVRRHE